MSDTYSIRRFRSFSELPAPYVAVLGGGIERHGLFCEPEWFEYLMQNHFPATDELRLYGVEEADSGRPLLLAPLRYSTHDYGVRNARMIGSISHPENFATAALIFDPALEDPAEVMVALFRHFRQGSPRAPAQRIDVVRIWPVELDSRLGETVHRALRAAGFWLQSYANSYNRFENTKGMTYEAYFAQRSANLRYSVRRRQRALEKTGTLHVAIHRDEEGLEKAIFDYVFVSLASWKAPETTVADPIRRLIVLAARKGCLRLGILSVGGVPAAAQFWIVSAGTAHCARLAYHEAYKKQAVGVVLTSHMIAHVLDQDHVDKIDFGYGEEDYKGGWMKDARDYHGLLAFNATTPRGFFQALRHIAGRGAKRFVTRCASLLGWRKAKAEEAPQAE